MESADKNLQTSGAKFPGKIRCPGELIRLNSHQGHNSPPIRKLIGFDDPFDRYLLDGVVDELGFERNFLAKQLAPGHVLRKTGKAGQRIAWQYATKMTDYKSFVIVFGGLYENNL
jgi:hypothetical protein